MTEDALLEALRLAQSPISPNDDPGSTLAELAQARYGNSSVSARTRVSQQLRPLLTRGEVVRGKRYRETIAGSIAPVTVFRLAVLPKVKAKR